MLRPDEDDFLPDLPPLLDDGEAVTDVPDEDLGLDDEARVSALDDAAGVDDFADEDVDLPDDDGSWLDDSTAEVDDDEAESTSEAEYGFLDDRPVSDLDLGDDLDSESESGIVGDSGEEGTDEPLGGEGGDDDASDLPALRETDDDEDEEPFEDDLFPGASDEPTAPRTHDPS